MQTLSVLMCNIQSHAETSFVLKPGFNIIVSPGNNVGKSTIFKALRCVVESPNPFMDLRELLREGCSQGYVAFVYDDWKVVYWLIKKDTTAGVVAGFFEVTDPDGEITRDVRCPKSLLDALGIVLASNGKPINFNDAAATQLLVRDNAETDEIISRILVDEKVETLKLGLLTSLQNATRDKKEYERELAYLTRDLQSMQRHDSVDQFNKDYPLLECLCNVVDRKTADLEVGECRLGPISLQADTIANLIQVAGKLEQVPQIGQENVGIDLPENLPVVLRVSHILSEVGTIEDVLHITDTSDAEKVTKVTGVLLKVILTLQECRDSVAVLDRAQAEKDALIEELRKTCTVVDCPVKGQVFYSNEGCISVGDGSTFECQERKSS